MKKIVTFYIEVLLINDKFNSAIPVNDQNLLLPNFLTKIKTCIKQYQQTYPNQEITFTETYRSNTLQEKYFENGASKIKKNGMHHYGIAADCIFVVDGKKTYKGDINLLRRIYKTNGLTILGMWDPLHVQFITTSEQMKLRNAVNMAITDLKSVVH